MVSPAGLEPAFNEVEARCHIQLGDGDKVFSLILKIT